MELHQCPVPAQCHPSPPVCLPCELLTHNVVTHLEEDKLSPPVPLHPQGDGPLRTAWSQHPRAAQNHQDKAHTTFRV